MADSLELSLVMPAYNEEKLIGDSIRRVDNVIKQTKLKYELIVVDDGSVDKTKKIAMNFANNNGHTKVVSYERNIGKGYAIRKGFTYAVGDVLIFIDSDADIEPKYIALYMDALKHGDIAIASKWHPKSTVNVSIIRKLLSHGFNVLTRLLIGLRVSDTQTGLKAVKRNVLEKVFPKLAVKRYAFDAEFLSVANLYGFRIVELPVNVRIIRSFRFVDGLRMFLDLLGIAYRLRIIKFYQRQGENT